jgi:transcription antitermination factor NusG
MDLRTQIEISDELAMVAGPLRWHIARTQPGQDFIASKALKRRGYTVYHPTMPREYTDKHRRLQDGKCSMFGGYLFVLPPNHARGGAWEAIRTAPGVIYGDHALLRLNGSAATIPHNDPMHVGIVQIRELEESLWQITTNSESLPAHKVGDLVRIRKGPWIEFVGVIETLDNDARVGVLIELLGGRVRAFMSSAHLVQAAEVFSKQA